MPAIPGPVPPDDSPNDYRSRSVLRTIATGVRRGLIPSTEDDRQLILEVCRKYAKSSDGRIALRAASTLLLVESVNIRKDRADTDKQQGDARLRIQAIQAALATESGRAAAQQLTAALTAPQPVSPTSTDLSPSPPAPDAS